MRLRLWAQRTEGEEEWSTETERTSSSVMRRRGRSGVVKALNSNTACCPHRDDVIGRAESSVPTHVPSFSHRCIIHTTFQTLTCSHNASSLLRNCDKKTHTWSQFGLRGRSRTTLSGASNLVGGGTKFRTSSSLPRQRRRHVGEASPTFRPRIRR